MQSLKSCHHHTLDGTLVTLFIYLSKYFCLLITAIYTYTIMLQIMYSINVSIKMTIEFPHSA